MSIPQAMNDFFVDMLISILLFTMLCSTQLNGNVEHMFARFSPFSRAVFQKEVTFGWHPQRFVRITKFCCYRPSCTEGVQSFLVNLLIIFPF